MTPPSSKSHITAKYNEENENDDKYERLEEKKRGGVDVSSPRQQESAGVIDQSVLVSAGGVPPQVM